MQPLTCKSLLLRYHALLRTSCLTVTVHGQLPSSCAAPPFHGSTAAPQHGSLCGGQFLAHEYVEKRNAAAHMQACRFCIPFLNYPCTVTWFLHNTLSWADFFAFAAVGTCFVINCRYVIDYFHCSGGAVFLTFSYS